MMLTLSTALAITAAAGLVPPAARAADPPPPVIVPALGSFPQAVLLINFTDGPQSPEPLSYFTGLITSHDYPSTNHWCQEVSYGLMSIDGSLIHGWYNLSGPYADYTMVDAWGTTVLDMDHVLDEVLPLAEPYFYFPNYTTITACFNVPIVPLGFSYGSVRTLDGVQKAYQIIGTGSDGWTRQDVITHEILHKFGVVHTSGPLWNCGQPNLCWVDSQWDRMGGATDCPDTFPPDPVYGCMGAHTIAWHKHALGWIPDDRVYLSVSNARAGIITIERLALPVRAAGTYAYAKTHVFGLSGHFYTVEYRNWFGYDGVAAVPGEAVIIHKVQTWLMDRQAQVVDIDGNHDPNDAGAMWVPGETFTADSVNVIVHVESMGNNSAVVALSNRPRDIVYGDALWGGYEDGQSGTPWKTLAAAYASVHRSGTVRLDPGTYPENLRLTKPCRIERQGTTGTVTLGQ